MAEGEVAPTDGGGPSPPVPLATIVANWTRIGCTGFGGPPTHIALLRRLCVADRGWLTPEEFEDAIAATNLLPGPASTQLAIFCAWRLRGALGGLVGGMCFIVPGLLAILGLSALFLSAHPPSWIRGAAAGAGSAVAAVAVHAAAGLAPASWRRAGPGGAARARWISYLVAGVTAALAGPWLVALLLAAGLVEIATRRPWRPLRVGPRAGVWLSPPTAAGIAGAGGLAALSWVAVKVGALSYGGGFVIVPLMQHDAVRIYHWMSAAQFLDAVALGQITPGPVVQTVAVVGYAAAGVGGGLLAAAVAFAPSFGFVLAGGHRFGELRRNARVQAFLAGAGPAAIGAIAGSALPLAAALTEAWQFGLLAAAGGGLLLRRGVVGTLVGAGAVGALAALAGASVPY